MRALLVHLAGPLVALGACAADELTADGGLTDAAMYRPDGDVPDGDVPDASASDASPDAGATDRCTTPAHAAACDDHFCVIPAGCFVMGSPPGELCREPGEVQHEVELTRDFLLMRHEITRAEVAEVLGDEPFGVLLDHPATELTWHQIAAYANAISDRDGLERCYECQGRGRDVQCAPAVAPIYDCRGYRHPTEAEWEHAYRAGTTSALYSGAVTATCASDPRADSIAWYGSNSVGALHPRAGRAANAWGLEDMAGNAFEWTFDRHTALTAARAVDPVFPIDDPDAEVMMRSGSWEVTVSFLRAASRVPFPATIPLFSIGGRVARTLSDADRRPVGVSPVMVSHDAPAPCSPNVLPAPVQIPAGPRIHVQLPFGGEQQLLLVDTGSPLTNFYLAPTAPELALGLGVVTLGCEQFGFAGRNVRAGQRVRGLPVLGAIGLDWLLSAPTQLDMGSESLTRWASADEIPGLAGLGRLPFTMSQGRMLVEARLDGARVRLLLDTGTPRTLWIGPTGAPDDRVITLVGESGDRWEVREGDGRIELAGEAEFAQPIWRTPSAGGLERLLLSLGPDVVGILGLESFRRRPVYFGADAEAVLLGPVP